MSTFIAYFVLSLAFDIAQACECYPHNPIKYVTSAFTLHVLPPMCKPCDHPDAAYREVCGDNLPETVIDYTIVVKGAVGQHEITIDDDHGSADWNQMPLNHFMKKTEGVREGLVGTNEYIYVVPLMIWPNQCTYHVTVTVDDTVLRTDTYKLHNCQENPQE